MRGTHDGSGNHHPASTPLGIFLMSRGGGARPSRRSCPEKIYLLMGRENPPKNDRREDGEWREVKDERWRGRREGKRVGRWGNGGQLVLLPTTQRQ